PNASLRAIAGTFNEPAGWVVATRVPFSSARKWGAVTFSSQGTWVLGAPEVLMSGAAGGDVERRVDEHARSGRRVLLLARAPGAVDWDEAPSDLTPVALVALAERVREDAADTLGYFASQGVTVKVISGDSPRTVAAIAGAVGVPDAEDPVDARDLPDGGDPLADELERHSVFGRVQP